MPLDYQLQSIHPFPARMAPELALEEIVRLPPKALILDPMVGSGTVLRVAATQGRQGLGYDLDPLAVLISRVWARPLDIQAFEDAAEDILARANDLPADSRVPWIDDDPETTAFVHYWFAQRQQADLHRLSSLLHPMEGTVADALRVALSRLIITKDRGASLARDVSHSRPHRVKLDNDFPVFTEFRKSVRRLARLLNTQPANEAVNVHLGDARALTDLPPNCVDAVITSPPYLNALDYMRGHRLSLVWLGFQMHQLRAIRQISIGVERALEATSTQGIAGEVRAQMPELQTLQLRDQRIVERFIVDIYMLMSEVQRVLRPSGVAVVVVGNSRIRGVDVSNAGIVTIAARAVGLRLEHSHERALPGQHRYLPPPISSENSNLKNRMRTETILKFVKV